MGKFASFAAALAVIASAFPGAADPGPGGFMSPNVSWVANVPLDSPGVGARVVKVRGQTRLYVAGIKGVSVWNLSDPARPVPIGTLPLPNWQNEDVDVAADGSMMIVANDAFDVSHVVDTSDPTKPVPQGIIPGEEHTITCAVANCAWAYGRTGAIYDLRNRAKPVKLEISWLPKSVKLTAGVHDLFRDDTGLLFVDTTPRLILDPRRDPTRPALIAQGTPPKERNVAYQHNSFRPRARDWRARKASDRGAALRPGELLIANGETNFNPRCGGASGPISTWSLRDFDKGAEIKVLDVFRPVSGTWSDGSPAVNALGCSGHWFTERNYIVAAGWYEHGVRFLKVSPENGKIREVGYFQPVVGSASGAYWIDDSYVYVIDYERGIDILRFDRSAPGPTDGQIRASWMAKADVVSAVAEAERLACKLAVTQG